MLKAEVFKDLFGFEVKPHDEVAVLYQPHFFNGYGRAVLYKAEYLGKGQYGYSFRTSYGSIINKRKPVVVKKSRRGR